MSFDELFRAPDPSGIFELVDLLGEGSYGSVYKGRHIRTGEMVAIKVMEIVEEELAEIKLEVDILKLFKHPNIVKYFGTYLRYDKLWLAMELCQIGSVLDIFKVTGKGLKEDQVSFICHESLKGLEYMHQKGVIHRDIKAGNILLNINGDVKLADFGVSASTTASTRRRNTFIGTPYWMAPEVILCDKDETATYDEKCDIWGIAITAIEMFEMDPPLSDLHPMRALFLIPSNKPPTFANPKKCSKAFKDFVKCGLVKDPKKRPSATELLQHEFVNVKYSTKRIGRHVLQDIIEKMIPHEEFEDKIDNEVEVQKLKSEDSQPSIDIKTAGAVSVRKKTSNRKTILYGASEEVFKEPPALFRQPEAFVVPMIDPDSIKDASEDSDGKDKGWDLMTSSLGAFAEEIGPNKLISNPLYALRNENVAEVKQKEKIDFNRQPLEVSMSMELASPLSLNDEEDFYSRKNSLKPLPVIPDEEGGPPQTDTISQPIKDRPSRDEPSPRRPDPVSVRDLTLNRLPHRHSPSDSGMEKRKQEEEKEVLKTQNLATTSSSATPSSVPKQIKAFNMIKDFPNDITCACEWGDKYLFGTPSGLYKLDQDGTLTLMIPNTKFHTISVLNDYNVLVGVCGRHRHIRMYTLESSIDMSSAVSRKPQDPYVKLRDTGNTSSISIVRSRGTVFLIASIKKKVVLFMWAEYPFNKFMKIKDFYLPETALSVEPILVDGRIEVLAVQCSSRYTFVNVDTNEVSVSDPPKKCSPFSITKNPAGALFLSYNKLGHFIENSTFKPVGKTYNWRFLPTCVVTLSDLILVFGPKVIDIFSIGTGEIVQTYRHKESKKMKYLLLSGEEVIASSQIKSNSTNVYIMRPCPVGQETMPVSPSMMNFSVERFK